MFCLTIVCDIQENVLSAKLVGSLLDMQGLQLTNKWWTPRLIEGWITPPKHVFLENIDTRRLAVWFFVRRRNILSVIYCSCLKLYRTGYRTGWKNDIYYKKLMAHPYYVKIIGIIMFSSKEDFGFVALKISNWFYSIALSIFRLSIT